MRELTAILHSCFPFLAKTNGIRNLEEFKKATDEVLKKVDFNIKKRDFEHLLLTRKIVSVICWL